MTDQSRVEAVADALLLCSKMQIDLGKADLMQMAQAAIEANDAWLIAQQQAGAKQFYKTMNERHRRLKEVDK